MLANAWVEGASVEYEIVVPGVELLESMRSVGYSFSTAVADLVDNSISAGSRHVEIVGDPVEARFVTILDDGEGMSPDAARSALQLAGSARNRERAATDLGRFGLGLKTASLSQARKISVITRHDGVTTALQWDIDHVLATQQWSLTVLAPAEIAELPGATEFMARATGTLVVWQALDLMLGGARDPDQVMRDRLSSLRDDLALTFHRFLKGGQKSELNLTVNGLAVRSIDPFLEDNPRTQVSPVESMTIEGERVEFQAYTLPHQSGLTPVERKRWDLTAGMRERQGFYIYRNRRLISFGHWYGLARREELSKQSRVRVDIPNTVDHLWQLDIKKSRAEPPQAFRQKFKRVMEQVVGQSRRVHTFRGRRADDNRVVHLWSKITDRDGYRYEINNDHPLIAAFEKSLDSERRRQFRALTADLSSAFPVADVYLEASKGGASARASKDESDVLLQLSQLRDAGAFAGQAPDAIARVLAITEPFDRVSNLQEMVNRFWS
jgi:hypothetical protein